MAYFIGMDVGGTHCRMKAADGAGKVLGTFEGPGCSLNTDAETVCRERYRRLILPALGALGLAPEDCGGLFAAVSGLDFPAQSEMGHRIFREMGFPEKAVRLVNDCEIFLYLTRGASLVLISGTGSICYGRNAGGEIVRCGGWNHVISDEGSGFDMGLLLLQAAGNWLDGRGGSGELARGILEACKVSDLEALNGLVNRSLFEKARIAGLTKAGYQAALAGDETAREIHRVIARRLADLVWDTVKKMGESQTFAGPLWLWGGLLENDHLVREFLMEELRERLPMAEGRIPQISALDIALKEAPQAAGAP